MAGNFIFGWNYIFLKITFVWFYRRTGGFFSYSGVWNIDCFFLESVPCICSRGESRLNHDVIEYRSFFWKKNIINFSDITRSVHKENGTLEIYAGDKIIFKF